ncbi:MAG: polysaccharide deacetylase family protein [Firmicutes bacterium]|jgi:peptidoglycan/xylan/chitin deacetylase (PgdA/CDA1 family)|nr:polysaccharide deacetylase family protein [Bacillota bacterium]HQD39339.1 polysaccharide deacetylase family protein [Bacillota bacterium]
MRFFAITIPGKLVHFCTVLIAAGVIVGGGIKLTGLVQRRLYAIAPGVTLGGEPIGGMFPEELEAHLRKQQERWSVPSVNARWQEGKVTTAMAGVELDVAATVQLAMEAESGAALLPVLRSVEAAVDKEFYQAVYQRPEAGRKVALTINVDWGEEHIAAMLAALKKAEAKATFFVTGSWAEKNPDLLREMASCGHEIGNHGMKHIHPAQLDQEGIKKLIGDAESVIQRVLEKEPAKLYAPAYGEVNEKIVAAAAEIGYRTIMWSADTIDWQKPAPAVIVQRVQRKIAPGGIVLMHPTENTVKALPEMLKMLAEKNLQPVTVGELLKAKASP